MKISLAEARHIFLSSQGLVGNPHNTVLDVIRRLGYVQIDTLATAARAHHHTLWSRTPCYQENFLNTLLKEKKVFEYWSHAASYLPMNEYRFSLFLKNIYAMGKSHWFGQDLKMKQFVLEKIEAEGPLQSKDFEHLHKGSGNWYEWKPAKRALEQLFMEGKLMVAERKGFHKLYDLTQRVLPSELDTEIPSEDAFAEHLILKAIAAYGIVTSGEICYLRSYAKKAVAKSIKRLLKEGHIISIKIEGVDGIYYALKENCEAMLGGDDAMNDEVHILSPFDNAVIQRKRLQTLFNYDYRIECYLPEAKRKYGYFCLPVLYKERFVARFDPKADRATKKFHIRGFYAEKNWRGAEEFALSFVKKLKAFAAFTGCEKILAEGDLPASIQTML